MCDSDCLQPVGFITLKWLQYYILFKKKFFLPCTSDIINLISHSYYSTKGGGVM